MATFEFSRAELPELRRILDRAMNTLEPDHQPDWLKRLSDAVDERMVKAASLATTIQLAIEPDSAHELERLRRLARLANKDTASAWWYIRKMLDGERPEPTPVFSQSILKEQSANDCTQEKRGQDNGECASSVQPSAAAEKAGDDAPSDHLCDPK